MNGTSIELSHVSAGYGTGSREEEMILHDISFSVPMGRNVCILGKNGCGKTTLLRTMVGLLPSTGEIRIDGINLREMKRKEIARHVSMMTQFSDIFFSYSVFETVLLGRYLYSSSILGEPTKEDREKAGQCLEAVGLYELRNRQITELSGGQLQRVFLARTIAQGAPVILLDEPTNHLDLSAQKSLVDYLKKWSSEPGRTVVGVFHDISLAVELADYLVFMKDGKILAHGDSGKILSAGLLEEVYDFNVAAHMKEVLEQWEDIR
jgi:iron complex transport system ATP-binding protein